MPYNIIRLERKVQMLEDILLRSRNYKEQERILADLMVTRKELQKQKQQRK